MKRKSYIYYAILVVILLGACNETPQNVSRIEENFKNKFKIGEALLDFDSANFNFNTLLVDSSNYELTEIINLLNPIDTRFINVRKTFIEDVLLKFKGYKSDLRSIVIVEKVNIGAKTSIGYKLMLVGADTTLAIDYSYGGEGFIKRDEKFIGNAEIFMAIDSSLYINKTNLPSNYKKALCVTVITNDTVLSQLDNKYYPRLFIE